MSKFEPVYIVDGARSPFLKSRNVPGPFSASDLATIGVVGTWIEGKPAAAPPQGAAAFAAKLVTSKARKL